MHDDIYKTYVQARVAKRLGAPIFWNRAGEITGEEDACGYACDIEITHPNYILHAGEMGYNTNQSKARHNGGEALVVEKGTEARKLSNTEDAHYTCLDFTTFSRDLLLFVGIFTCENWRRCRRWDVTCLQSSMREQY